MRRLIALAGLLGVGAALIWSGAGARTPSPGDRVLPDPDQTVAFWQEKARAEPDGALTRVLLAEAYLNRYRCRGDLKDVPRAEAAARRSLAHRETPRALHALAAALLTRHRFSEATAVAERAGDSAQSLYQRAEASLESGNRDGAERLAARGRLRAPADDPFGRALLARIREARGASDEALALYQEAAALADASHDLPAVAQAWFHTRLAACHLHRGAYLAARVEIGHARRIHPDDWRARRLEESLP